MANRGKEIDIRNFESSLTSTPWAKKMMINFSFLSNRCVFDSCCHWFSIKFLKRYLVCGFVHISIHFFASESCICNEGNPLFTRESKANLPTWLNFAEA